MPAFGFPPCAPAAIRPPDNGVWRVQSDLQQHQQYNSEQEHWSCSGQEEHGDGANKSHEDGDAYYCADDFASYVSSYMPTPIPNPGFPYIPACSLSPYPKPWSGPPMDPSAGSGNSLFSPTWGLHAMTSSAQSCYATCPAYATAAHLQTPALAYCVDPIFHSPWLQSTPGVDSAHKPVTNISMELTQPQVRKASSDKHRDGFWGCGAEVQGTFFPTPATQWDEIKASSSLVIGEPAADSSSTKKEDNIHDHAENANDTSSKNPYISNECELLLVSICNLSTLLTNKLSNYSNIEDHLDVNMLESTIGLLSRCLLEQSADNSTKLSRKLPPQSLQSIQEPSSKSDILHRPCAMLKDNARSASSHEENEAIVEEAVVQSVYTLFEKDMKNSRGRTKETGASKEQVSSSGGSGLNLNGLRHEFDFGLSSLAGGVFREEHISLEDQPSNKMETSLHSPRSQDVTEQCLIGESDEAQAGDVMNEILTRSHLESVGAFDSDTEDWEYVISPPGRAAVYLRGKPEAPELLGSSHRVDI